MAADDGYGLLGGFDPAWIKSLVAQFEPSEDDKKQARMESLLTGALSMLGTQRGHEWEGIRNAGLLGMGQYRDNIKDIRSARADNLGLASSAMGLQEQMRKYSDAELMRRQQMDFARMYGGAAGAQPPQYQQSNTQMMGPPGPDGQMQQQPITPTLREGMRPSAGNASPFGGDGMSQPPSAQNGQPSQAGQQAGPPGGMPSKREMAQRYQGYGDYWMSLGRVDKAQSYYELAQKIVPQLKEQRNLTQNGQRVVVNLYNDGSHEILPDVGPDQEKAHFLNNGQQTIAADPYSGRPIQGGGVYQMQQTPDSIASNATTIRGQNMTDARSREQFEGAQNLITNAGIDNAAARYNLDGTLPPLGMGKAGAQERAAILNRAAEQTSGISGEQQRINQIGNKANTAALAKLQQQATMVGAFEKTFNQNADLVLEYSNKVDRTGVPLANKWINVGKRAITGDPDLSAYDVAVKSATNEYTKIISGSMGNTPMAEGEIKKVESMLSAAQTPAQVQEVIKFMRRETQNRMNGFKDQTAELRGQMRGGTAGAANSADAAPASTGALTLTDKAKGNATARVMVGRVLSSGDPEKIRELRSLGYVQ